VQRSRHLARAWLLSFVSGETMMWFGNWR